MGALILRGEQPSWISGLRLRLGYGDGSGYGYGYGDGSGYGYGYGYGYGDGYGYGYGDGSGSGYGDGSGDGSGYGYGYGDGYGSGSGYGYGDGSGYGYGDGSGYGSGYGDGSGYGYGSGSKEYWLATIDSFASKWPAAFQKRLATLRQQGVTIAFWRSDQKGLAANGGSNIEPAAPGVIHTAPGPLNLCNAGTLHATLLPPKWIGERWWIVALTGTIIGNEEKYGALSREILGEAI